MYLKSFSLPIHHEEYLLGQHRRDHGYIDNIYPCRIFPQKELEHIHFSPVTIFYGGNGSGKSTLLNLIADKLQLKRSAPKNNGDLFNRYLEHCSYSMAEDDEGDTMRIPNGSQIICSDDIFEFMLTARSANDQITENKEIAEDMWLPLKYGPTLKFRGLQDYDSLKFQLLARKKKQRRSQFVHRTVGKEIPLASNGETALHYFQYMLQHDTLYCLDEPENSMSPKMQLDLQLHLEQLQHYCGCQFIIATHSPFLLSISGAKIYDLDVDPARPRHWWELENIRIYYEFFRKNQKLLEMP